MKKPVSKKAAPKKFQYQSNSSYLRAVYTVEEFVKIVPKAIAKIKTFRRRHSFDAIAFTGTSGAALAYPLSYALKIPLICVRKSKDSGHFGGYIEGCTNARKYLIVDDFIESGYTIRNIVTTIKEYASGEPAGILLYSDRSYARGKFYADIPLIRMIYGK